MDTIRVLSLGAGVQSSTLYYLYTLNRLPPIDFAVFADTHHEPRAVYEYLDKLKALKGPKIYISSKGDLGENLSKIPFFTKHPETGKKGITWRQCTPDYKVAVVNKVIRGALGILPRKRMTYQVEVVLGFSTDEKKRMFTSPDVKWKTLSYPLIEKLDWSRTDCMEFMAKTHLGTPPRSACVFCPYQSNEKWRDLKKNHPEEFERACQTDDSLRSDKRPEKLKGEPFLHPSLKPLREVVFDDKSDLVQTGLGLVRNDLDSACEGMCGL